jgi:hypothetical protein
MKTVQCHRPLAMRLDREDTAAMPGERESRATEPIELDHGAARR